MARAVYSHTILNAVQYYIHIQIPLTGYVGLILRSTGVPTASRCTVEGTMRVI